MLARLLIFGVLGPVVGVAALLLFATVASGRLPPPQDWPSIVVLAYIVGCLPALLVGVFDGVLAKRTAPLPRMILAAAFGAALSFVPLVTAYLMGFWFGPGIGVYVGMDVVAAAVCSGLSALWERRAPGYGLRSA